MGIFREMVNWKTDSNSSSGSPRHVQEILSHSKFSCVLQGFRIQEAKSAGCLPADASQISDSARGQAPYDGAEQIIWE